MILNTKYQLVFIGDKNPLKNQIIELFYKRIEDLGLDRTSTIVLYKDNFKTNYIANAPTACIYFGQVTKDFPDLNILDELQSDANFILPVVNNLENYRKLTPKQLYPINGFELKSEAEIEPLVSSILQGLSLLRLSRRLFISYRRNESSGVAIQLFERLEKAGFDVFLDTHSIKPGDDFLDELWHRLVDTDVVVLLNTIGFLGSKWTRDELAKASALSIGIIQLVWPTHSALSIAKFTIQMTLSENEFLNKKYNDSKSYLDSPILDNIVNQVESLRARTLGARQDNLVTEFMKSAKFHNVKADLQPEKFITIVKKDGKNVIMLPTVGVPHAFTYNQSEELIKRIHSKNDTELYLLYDHRNIREKWLNHLSWLDSYLPLKSKKITEIDKWLGTF